MSKTSSAVPRFLGILLLLAAALKGWQLLTEPVANRDIWTYRPFLALIVEFELALGIWLLSGLYKKAAWAAALVCFSAFSLITLYKGLAGAESCGCFGGIHVNPWITLFAIDLPAVAMLAIFRQRGEKLLTWPPLPRFAATVVFGLVILCTTTAILFLNRPANSTSSYEVLEPETWIGKRAPILEQIDIGDRLSKGTWLVLLFHYDCPDCSRAIPMYEQMARDLAGRDEIFRIALVEIPPYGQSPAGANSPCTRGRLSDTKDWFVTTPAVALLEDGRTKRAWEGKAPDLDTILDSMAAAETRTDGSGETAGMIGG